MTNLGQQDAVTRRGLWAAILERLGGGMALLAAFAVAYALLIWLGYLFREPEQQLTIMWPAAGLLFTALWVSERKWWPVFLGIQVAVELLMGLLLEETFNLRLTLLYALADSIDAIVRCVARATADPQRSYDQGLACVEARAGHGNRCGRQRLPGCVCGNAVGQPAELYLHQYQIWWAGNWLGTLVILPVVFGWVVPDAQEPVIRNCACGRASTWRCWRLRWPPVPSTCSPRHRAARSRCCSCRSSSRHCWCSRRSGLPPRWAATLAMMAAFIAAAMASQRIGPFVVARPVRAADPGADVPGLAGGDPVPVHDIPGRDAHRDEPAGGKREPLSQLRRAQQRGGVARGAGPAHVSVHAAWPSSASGWRQHAHVAECSLSYGKLDPPETPSAARPWRREIPWNAIYDQHLDQAARQNYSMDGLRFDVTPAGQAAHVHHFLHRRRARWHTCCASGAWPGT